MIKPVYLSIVGSLVAGCATTSQLAPGLTQEVYPNLPHVEKTQRPPSTDQERDRLAQLFADKANYVALAFRDDTDATLPRLSTSLPPKYPFGLGFSDTKALVKVAVVVSEKGVVEETRLYEASDMRFADEALDVVRDWTFHPGTRNGAASKFLLIVPIHFDGRQK